MYSPVAHPHLIVFCTYGLRNLQNFRVKQLLKPYCVVYAAKAFQSKAVVKQWHLCLPGCETC